LAAKLERPEDAASYGLGPVTVTVTQYDPAAGTAALTLTAVAARN